MPWHARQYRKDGATSTLRVQVRSSCSRSFFAMRGEKPVEIYRLIRETYGDQKKSVCSDTQILNYHGRVSF